MATVGLFQNLLNILDNKAPLSQGLKSIQKKNNNSSNILFCLANDNLTQ